MLLFATILLIFGLLLASEWWWRTRKPHDEFSRKFIHIAVGSFAAFWPWYLSWGQILFLGVSFIIVVALSKYLNIFQAIHAVERPTWGEICFALSITILVFVMHEPWIYAVALLHMSLADGLAALTGVKWGKGTAYKVFGHTKSLVGSVTFLAVSLALLLSYGHFIDPGIGMTAILSLALGTMAMENIGVAGLDNLLVPLAVGLVLQHAA